MSIHPVPIIPPATETAEARDSGRAPSSRPAPPRPDSGNAPDPEAASSQNNSPLSRMAEDEVEVQRDSQTNGEIVVRYVDHSGNVILQMPSAQVLNVTRAIDQDLEREQEVRAKEQITAESSRGGKSDGH